VAAQQGATARFAAKAADPDGDALTYQWTVDGKRAGGNTPTLEVPVSGERRVALAVTDGKLEAPLRRDWRIAPESSALAMTAQPARLATLAFDTAQVFTLTAPASERDTPIQIAWAVDGKAAADGPSFRFIAADPEQVRERPIEIRATASDARGRTFAKTWPVRIVPPPPRLGEVSPPPGAIDAQPGRPQRFTVRAAADPIGAQRLRYVFTVNGKETQLDQPTYELEPTPGETYTIVASIRDNFGQALPKALEPRWKVGLPEPAPAAPAPPQITIERLVEAWLDNYRALLMGKNTDGLCPLLNLSPARCATLASALAAQNELEVQFSGVTITPNATGACASYTRRDSFRDPNNAARAFTNSEERCFVRSGDRVELAR
jgi:hypothetical protein